MKSICTVLVFFGFLGTAFAHSEVSSRAEALVHDVNRDGLDAVARRSKSPLDLSLLELIADVMGEHAIARSLNVPDASEKPAWLLEGTSVVHGHNRAPLWLIPNVSDVPIAKQTYHVVFENLSDETLSEVTLFWRTKTAAVAGYRSEVNLLPGDLRAFNLDRCDVVVSYVLGVFVNGKRVLRLPPEGQEMTPELASRLHPQDDNPCSDSWSLHAQTAP